MCYCVFVSLCCGRQWLPPEKIEPLGMSSESDNAKIGMAGSSKRSVKEAYTRAKQWLRRRNRHRNFSGVSDTEDADGDDSNTVDIDVD